MGEDVLASPGDPTGGGGRRTLNEVVDGLGVGAAQARLVPLAGGVRVVHVPGQESFSGICRKLTEVEIRLKLYS